MSCCQIALNKQGIKYNKYFASEIEKPSIQVTQHNYPNTIQLGDVTKVDFSQLPQIDLITAGSPCQDLSGSNPNGLGLNGEKSKLYYEFLKSLTILKPKYFLLENVKPRQQVWVDMITNDLLLLYPDTKLYKINSNSFSAQNRLRYYWTNIPVDQPIPDKCSLVFDDIIDKSGDFEYVSDKVRDIIKNTKRVTTKSRNGNYIQWDTNGKKNSSQWDRGFFTFNKIPTLTKTGTNKIIVCLDFDKDLYRKVNPLEAERLQTVPDNYTKVPGVTDNKRYGMLGNGWTVDVIAFLFNGLKK